MFNTSEAGTRIFAGLSALAISAFFMATAIVPATPAGVLV